MQSGMESLIGGGSGSWQEREETEIQEILLTNPTEIAQK